MQSVWGVYVPVGAKDFPGPIALRKQFRRCGCGQMTFLSLPCRNCGAQKSEPAFRWALRKAWTRRIGRWILAAVYLLLAGLAALQIWVPLAGMIAVGTVAAVAVDLIRSTPDSDICYWLFLNGAREKKKLTDTARIEALTDAYDGDLRRLEQMLQQDSSPECAESVFYMAQDLTRVFHNRRVSALLANCLARLPLSEGICVDLDQVCAWLEPEDISPEILSKLGECARFTCLPAGGPTAGFVGRFCAFRIQESLEKNSATGQDIPDLSFPGTISLRKAITSKKERACLSALWNLAAVYSAPQTLNSPVPSKYFSNTTMDWTPDDWCKYAWRYPATSAFQEIEDLLSDRLGSSLKNQWRKGQNIP